MPCLAFSRPDVCVSMVPRWCRFRGLASNARDESGPGCSDPGLAVPWTPGRGSRPGWLEGPLEAQRHPWRSPALKPRLSAAPCLRVASDLRVEPYLAKCICYKSFGQAAGRSCGASCSSPATPCCWPGTATCRTGRCSRRRAKQKSHAALELLKHGCMMCILGMTQTRCAETWWSVLVDF